MVFKCVQTRDCCQRAVNDDGAILEPISRWGQWAINASVTTAPMKANRPRSHACAVRHSPITRARRPPRPITTPPGSAFREMHPCVAAQRCVDATVHEQCKHVHTRRRLTRCQLRRRRESTRCLPVNAAMGTEKRHCRRTGAHGAVHRRRIKNNSKVIRTLHEYFTRWQVRHPRMKNQTSLDARRAISNVN